MKLSSESFAHEGRLPPRCAWCVAHPERRAEPGPNLNPALSWSGVPNGTRSLVLLCHDQDAPVRRDIVNREGKSLSPRARRREFFHWVLVDIPADAVGIQEGEFSDGVTVGGKPGSRGPRGTRQGINDYTGYFADDERMAGDYFGYDGPCPPWNDPVVHRYHFTLHAVDFERCPVGGTFDGRAVRRTLDNHVIESVRLTGTYSLHADAEGGTAGRPSAAR